MIKILEKTIEFLNEKEESVLAIKNEDIPKLISALVQIYFSRTNGIMLEIFDETKTKMFTLLDNRKYEKEKEDVETKLKLLLDDTNSTPM